jgi:hypothetical protein
VTSALLSHASADVPATTTGWSSRAVEFLAVGGISFALFPLAWLLRASLGLDSSELAVGFVLFHAAHFINDPHFSVTYLLFYKNAGARAFSPDVSRAQRARYLVAGLIVPALLVSWAACALIFRSAQALGWMVQLMFLLVGWHYAKQGFGVLTVLSARRGVRFSSQERSVILTHCFAAWAFAWANPTRAAGEFEEKGVVYWGPAHPRWLELATGGVFALSTLALVITLGSKWRREGRLPLTPLTGFLVTIWLWTVYTALDPLVRYVIPALHSIQYMYFVWLMKRNEARASEGPPSFGPPVSTRLAALALSALALGFLLFRGAPSLLDAALVPDWSRSLANRALGETPFFAAFFVVVNIHHYFMDYVIWRRENPDTQYLQEPVANS